MQMFGDWFTVERIKTCMVTHKHQGYGVGIGTSLLWSTSITQKGVTHVTGVSWILAYSI